MNSIDPNFNKSRTTNPGQKAQEPAKQARDFGRDIKSQASGLADSAMDAVKSQAANLTESAKDMAADAGEKLRGTLQDQKTAGADYVGNVADMIRRAASEFDSDLPQAGQYIRKAATQLDNVSEAMRNRDMSEIVGNVQQFARKQPTAFFGAAVLLGFAAVRFLKSGSGASNSNMPGQTASNGGGRSGGTNGGNRAMGM